MNEAQKFILLFCSVLCIIFAIIFMLLGIAYLSAGDILLALVLGVFSFLLARGADKI